MKWIFHSPLHFFGLTPSHKPQIHSEIFDICYYGKGGFTHTEVYGMPVYLRKWYLRKLSDTYQDEAKAAKKANKPNKGVQRAGISNR